MSELYIVNAFVGPGCAGNPAAVQVSDAWPSDEEMQAIAHKIGLSDTAFAVKEEDRYAIRWFTPVEEINLCGHATLATGYVIMTMLELGRAEVAFDSPSGELRVRRFADDLFELDFPAYRLQPAVDVDEEAVAAALGARPREIYIDRDLLCVFDDAEVVENLEPDFEKVATLPGLMCHVTAQASTSEAQVTLRAKDLAAGIACVSRSFGPKLGADEDPVCGSGHCMIAPYWARRLGVDELLARQASKRGGLLRCRLEGERVKLAGELEMSS